METSKDDQHGIRGKWARKFEYFLSVLGFIVGFGNVWRFPYICMINGGGAFLVPYVIFLILCGLPTFFLETSLGQFTAKPVNKVWGICPLFKGLGIGMMVLQVNVTLYYNTLLGWILYYMYLSCLRPLPWSDCGNAWNTENCRLRSQDTTNRTNTSYLNTTVFNTSSLIQNTSTSKPRVNGPAEEFWRYEVLQLSSGLSNLGHLVDHTAVTTLICYVVVFLCLIRGIKSVGKVVYVTALLPYVLLTVILIKGLTLPGSLDGVIYYLKPDFSKLLHIQVWVQAGVQVFYSLGTGWGCLITMASFNKFNNNCLRDSVIMALAGEGTSVFGGLAIFSVLGFMAHRSNVPVSEVVQSGPGLGFVAYPEALAELPLPNVWAFLFFLAMFTVGLDSHFGILESLCDAVLDIVPMFQKRATLFRGATMAAFYVISLVFCTQVKGSMIGATYKVGNAYTSGDMIPPQGGIYLFQLADWYVASMANFIFAFLECIMVAWIYGSDRFSQDIRLMIGRDVPVFMRICWSFITPIIIMSLLVFLFATYKAPEYGDYKYPAVAEVFGWIFGFLPVIPIIVIAIQTIIYSPGRTFKEKLQYSIRPSEKWVPASEDAKKNYNSLGGDQALKVSLLERIKRNTLGHKDTEC